MLAGSSTLRGTIQIIVRPIQLVVDASLGAKLNLVRELRADDRNAVRAALNGEAPVRAEAPEWKPAHYVNSRAEAKTTGCEQTAANPVPLGTNFAANSGAEHARGWHKWRRTMRASESHAIAPALATRNQYAALAPGPMEATQKAKRREQNRAAQEAAQASANRKAKWEAEQSAQRERDRQEKRARETRAAHENSARKDLARQRDQV